MLRWGAQMAETLAKVLRTADPGSSSTAASDCGVERCGVAIRLERTGTLLGPETINAEAWLVQTRSRMVRGPRPCRPEAWADKAFWVWCWLRIAQWMRASFLLCGQVAEGVRWMPWHQEPMKDVGGRDRPGGAVNRAVIPGCPNGGTCCESCRGTSA